MTVGYLAPEGYEAQLAAELGDTVVERVGQRLFLCENNSVHPTWVANVWRDVRRLPITSISEGAKKLRAWQRSWAFYPSNHFRRAQLIAERLPHVSAKPLKFGVSPPSTPLGSWTLAAPDLIIASADCDSPMPNGEWQFIEDRDGPPSRAYLKLWEALTRLGRFPVPGETCLDLGASPGGWSWVLANLGADVTAVDRAPLNPRLAGFRNLQWRQGSAFALEPTQHPPVDWLFCDVICYPPRLFTLVRRWIETGRVRRIICTIKFQGKTDYVTPRLFLALKNAQLFHLHHNKHELTFVWSRDAD